MRGGNRISRVRTVAHIAILVALSWLPSACQRTATLSGDVFVTMKSGDVKRGADVAVVLVPKTSELDNQWNGLIGALREELNAAQQALQRAKAARDLADHQNQVAFNAHMAAIRGGGAAIRGGGDTSFSEWQAATQRASDAAMRLFAQRLGPWRSMQSSTSGRRR